MAGLAGHVGRRGQGKSSEGILSEVKRHAGVEGARDLLGDGFQEAGVDGKKGARGGVLPDFHLDGTVAVGVPDGDLGHEPGIDGRAFAHAGLRGNGWGCRWKRGG